MQMFSPAANSSSPVRVFGLAPFSDGEGYSKCHREIFEKIPRIAELGHRSCGGRVCFRTDADSFTLTMELERVIVDVGMSIWGAAGANVYEGARRNARYLGMLAPGEYSDDHVIAVSTFKRVGSGMDDITVFLPRNETVTNFSVSVEDGFSVEPPTPYRNERPAIFYGSSITEGGCATRVGCNYVSLISNRLNLDIRNYGFSGNAKGDPQFADYILKQDPCLLVYDYDHNAPTPQWLEQTHEAFFKRLRSARPDLPIIIMSRPDFPRDAESVERRAIIKRTYDNAVAAGDKLVRYIDGGTFFPEDAVDNCSLDGVHPNDMGFAYMSEKLTPLIEEFADYIR